MSNYAKPPASRTPALDFLRKVEIWQQAPGGTAGIAVAMPAGDEVTLNQLLETFRRQGDSAQLEAQARYWLIGYREMQPPLTGSQQAELDVVVDGLHDEPARDSQISDLRKLVIGIVAALLILFLAIGGRAIWHAIHPANPVQNGVPSLTLPQQVPPGTTDLQNFKSDWGPWKQLAASQQNPQTGAPALLLLEPGTGYFASMNWTVPAGSPAWAPDLGGNIGGVDVRGNYALIADADGTTWVVGVNQPFVFASNPGTVLKIDPTGNVLAIPAAHAIGLRHHI